MAYFPKSLMPKRLRKETDREVDGSPYVFNARDYNTHHREILEIQKALIAESPDVNNPISIEKALALLENKFNDITSSGLISRLSGVVLSGNQIQLPSHVVSTTSNGEFLIDEDDVIAVSSTSGFPSSGHITKINKLSFSSGLYNNAELILNEASGKLSFQEVISYSSKTNTTFNGLQRGLFGTSSQGIAGDENSVILGGRASLFYSLLGFDTDAKRVGKIALYHTQDLHLMSYFYGKDTASNNNVLDAVCHIGYSLLVVGQYEKINLSGLLAG